MKPIPNRAIQSLFSHHLHNYIDGELTIGDPFGPGVFNRTSKAIMSQDGDVSTVNYYVFDNFNEPLKSYDLRLIRLVEQVEKLKLLNYFRIVLVEQRQLNSVEDLELYEQETIDAGYEGIILRDPKAGYKFNRSTLREQALIKLKRFVDAEAVITGYEEGESNQNEATISETGYQVRSSHQSGMVPNGTLGALVCDWFGMPMKIGTGFTAAQRAELWAIRDQLLGQRAKFKFQQYGMKDVPRIPVFLGIRKD